MKTLEAYQFNRRFPDGTSYQLGLAVQTAFGWRFIPNVASRRSSRKFHPTMRRCLPRWLGYPHACESVRVK